MLWFEDGSDCDHNFFEHLSFYISSPWKRGSVWCVIHVLGLRLWAKHFGEETEKMKEREID